MQRVMNFPTAIREIIDGSKLTKLEWNNPGIYIFMEEELLKIKKGDGTIAVLMVSEADMVGIDWVVVEEQIGGTPLPISKSMVIVGDKGNEGK